MRIRPQKELFKHYFLLHFLIFLYSVYALLCKFAAQRHFLSFEFILLYGCALLVMLVYALFWQKILAALPLNVAFSNKAVVIIWGMLWGAVFFAEEINIAKIVGAALVIAGIYLVVNDEK